METKNNDALLDEVREREEMAESDYAAQEFKDGIRPNRDTIYHENDEGLNGDEFDLATKVADLLEEGYEKEYVAGIVGISTEKVDEIIAAYENKKIHR